MNSKKQLKQNNQQEREDIEIFKAANKSIILSFNISQDKSFDKVIIAFSKYNQNNKAELYMRSFIAKDELRAIMQLIMNGRFKNIKFSNTDKKGVFISYGGSKNGGTTLIRKGNQLKPAIPEGVESRILRIYFHKGSYYIQLNAYPGKIIRNGAISKAGDEIGLLYFKLDTNNLYSLASAIIKNV